MKDKIDKCREHIDNSQIFISLSCGVVFIMCIICIVAFTKTITGADLDHKESDRKWLELRDSLYSTTVPFDSLSIKSKLSFTQVDMFLRNQQLIMMRQDLLADDLRQEGNNLINKSNGWLAFWIAVLALTGVIVPIVLQFTVHKSEQEQLLKTLEAADIIRKKTEDHFEYMEITQLARNFLLICEDPESKVVEEREKILKDTWLDMIEKIKYMTIKYEANKNKDEISKNLIIALFLILNLLGTIRKYKKTRERKINLLRNQTMKLIKEFHEPLVDRKELIKSLMTYYNSLGNIV